MACWTNLHLVWDLGTVSTSFLNSNLEANWDYMMLWCCHKLTNYHFQLNQIFLMDQMVFHLLIRKTFKNLLFVYKQLIFTLQLHLHSLLSHLLNSFNHHNVDPPPKTRPIVVFTSFRHVLLDFTDLHFSKRLMHC